MEKKQETVLIIEDDKSIRETVRILLEGEGFAVEEATNGADGIAKVTKDTVLVILDVMMPGKNGYEVCSEIRSFSYVPILFLTAKSKEDDKLLGFTVGGDDYLIKPFSYSELSARVKALLRRRHVYDQPQQEVENRPWIEHGGLKINTLQNQVYVNGELVELTETEYGILLLFMKYPQKLFSIPNIYESVWHEEFLSSYANTVMVHIRRLRTKIEPKSQNPTYILTVWGKGYRFGKVS